MNRRRVVASALVIAVATLISSASPARPQSREQEPTPRLTAAFVKGVPAEYSRTPTGFRPPPYSPRLYRLCRNYEIHSLPPSGFAEEFSDYASGIADSVKSGEAAIDGLGQPALIVSRGKHEGYTGGEDTDNPKHDYSCAYAVGQLDYHGQRQLPPTRATFLGFGAEPVTATVVLKQVGPAPFSLVFYLDEGQSATGGPGGYVSNRVAPGQIVATGHVTAYLQDVSVDGTALNVGSSCRTDGLVSTPGNGIDPGALVLAGGNFPYDPEPDATINGGGAVAGVATIPPFIGCVTPSGENLDPLLTAAVSGARNYIQVDAGPACDHIYQNSCSATGMPTQSPNQTVTGGGNYAATTTGFKIIDNFAPFYTITCAKSGISGDFPDASGPPRGALASIQWTSFEGCNDGNGQDYTVTSNSDAYLSGLFQYPRLGSVTSIVDHIGLTVSIPGKCSSILSGYVVAQYLNAGSVLKVDPFQGLLSAPLQASHAIGETPCPNLPDTTQVNGYPEYTVSGTYSLGPVHPVVLPMPIG
jgi:hypothetical protein